MNAYTYNLDDNIRLYLHLNRHVLEAVAFIKFLGARAFNVD